MHYQEKKQQQYLHFVFTKVAIGEKTLNYVTELTVFHGHKDAAYSQIIRNLSAKNLPPLQR